MREKRTGGRKRKEEKGNLGRKEKRSEKKEREVGKTRRNDGRHERERES